MAGVEVRAVQRHIRMSPQKVRLVLDVVRGKNAREALAILKFLPHVVVDLPVGGDSYGDQDSGGQQRHRPGDDHDELVAYAYVVETAKQSLGSRLATA